MKNLVNEMFLSANRPEQGDNRSYFVKALNKVLHDGFIKISINQKDNYWTNKNFCDSQGNLKKFNIKIEGYGMRRRVYVPEMTAMDVLKQVGNFLLHPKVAENHKSFITLSGLEVCECTRCHGKGIIEAFNYYCQGICFECYGSKYSVRKFTVII